MPVYRFRVAWEDDENVYRDIELIGGQTFRQFNDTILKSYEFDNKHSSAFFESDERWSRNREISSEVASNKKGADRLSMDKTPVPALVDLPDKKFVFVYDPAKNWTFLISLIGINKEENYTLKYPNIAKVEGLAPSQTGIKGLPNEKLLEIEEKYDLNEEDRDDGYSDEGDENDEGLEDEATDDSEF